MSIDYNIVLEDVDRNYVATNGTDTSNEALLTSKNWSGRLRQDVLDHLDACGDHGATAEELQIVFHVKSQSMTPRITELTRAGYIKDSGLRRKTSSGCSARVHVLDGGSR